MALNPVIRVAIRWPRPCSSTSGRSPGGRPTAGRSRCWPRWVFLIRGGWRVATPTSCREAWPSE
jgi:hypothetical protein